MRSCEYAQWFSPAVNIGRRDGQKSRAFRRSIHSFVGTLLILSPKAVGRSVDKMGKGDTERHFTGPAGNRLFFDQARLFCKNKQLFTRRRSNSPFDEFPPISVGRAVDKHGSVSWRLGVAWPGGICTFNERVAERHVSLSYAQTLSTDIRVFSGIYEKWMRACGEVIQSGCGLTCG